jgi:hypothetical protein
LPLSYFLTEKCGDVSVGNKEDRNIQKIIENLKYYDRAFSTITVI